MRILLDYRPALRGPSGVGEYVYQLARALMEIRRRNGTAGQLDVTLFSSSWKDRLRLPDALSGVRAIDRHIPVSLLNFAWHRLSWPPVESLAGVTVDVAHSLHPLLMPARHAAQVVTIHDLNFLAHPERTRAEIRRDYPALVGDHAARADHVIVPSRFTASEVQRLLNVPGDRITVCSPGAPDWSPVDSVASDGYILFLGTLEPRKNVGTLLDAYEKLLALSASGPRLPDLVLAGQATAEAAPWLDRIREAPLAGRVRAIGYVDPADRRRVYAGARLLVQPSYEEGFGIPVLEAMSLGIPVVAANRGALPEVVGDAGLLVDAENSHDMANAVGRMTTDTALAAACRERGLVRSRQFRWPATAERVLDAYRAAIARRASLCA